MWVIDSELYLSPSDIMEYLYCPRFVYFMYCLDLTQNEKSRYKVVLGREIHRRKAVRNKKYLRKKIGAVDKKIEVRLISKRYGIHGIVDEVITLKNETMAPLDYKFSEYRNRMFRTHRFQSVLYAIMIEETFDKNVTRGYICYTRSKNKLKKVKIKGSDRDEAVEILEDVRKIINKGYFPSGPNSVKKCVDCTYNSVCIGAKLSV